MDQHRELAAPTGGLGNEKPLNGRDALGVELCPLGGQFIRFGWIVRDVLSRLQIDRGIRRRPTLRDVRQMLQAAARQLVGSPSKSVVPDGLVENMAVLDLRSVCPDNFPARWKL